jgi:hypothetical protein
MHALAHVIGSRKLQIAEVLLPCSDHRSCKAPAVQPSFDSSTAQLQAANIPARAAASPSGNLFQVTAVLPSQQSHTPDKQTVASKMPSTLNPFAAEWVSPASSPVADSHMSQAKLQKPRQSTADDWELEVRQSPPRFFATRAGRGVLRELQCGAVERSDLECFWLVRRALRSVS